MTSRSAETKPVAVDAAAVTPRAQPSKYPPPFALLMSGREKRSLGDFFGLKNFGVNLTRLAPGGMSSLRHAHSRQDEFVYLLEGDLTLVTDSGETMLMPGMCAGFPASGQAHHMINKGTIDAVYLEVGDRSTGDSAVYPDDDLQATLGSDGAWCYTRKDGSSF